VNTTTQKSGESASNGTTKKVSSKLDVHQATDIAKVKDQPLNLSEGSTSIGQLVLLKAGIKIELNSVAQQMVRPEKHIEAIKKSIAKVGQLTSCAVVQLPDGRYQLVAGVTRKTACDQLNVPCKCIVIEKMTAEEANEWVAREREATCNQRNLNSAQKALDGARLCKEVFISAAANRKRAGTAVSGETGESTDLAAKACGISPSSVKTALKILGSLAEQLIHDGMLKVLSTGKKIAELSDEQQKAAVKAFREGRTEELRELIGETTKTKKDCCGVVLPIGSPLLEVFEAANEFDKQVDILEKTAGFVRAQRSPEDVTEELLVIDLSKLQSIADQITAARPYAMCPICEAHGKDSECEWCQGRRWLTRNRYSHFEAAQHEAIKKIRPK